MGRRPLIGLTVPLLLWIGNKGFGISANLRHACAILLPDAAKPSFFRYNWRAERWNLTFAAGLILGGTLAGLLLAHPEPTHLSAAGATTVALVNVDGSLLAQEAEFVLPLRCGEERAVAATKSYLASLTALLPLLAELTADAALDRALRALPDALDRTLTVEGSARDLAARYRDATNLMVLARGLHFGVAQEAALKLKETCGVHAEAYSAAEFSHGPKRLLAEGVPVLGFTATDAAQDAIDEAYASLRALGADLQTLGPGAGPGLLTPATGHPLTDPVPSALAFYLFAAHLALHRVLNPDQPPLLSKVTRTR